MKKFYALAGIMVLSLALAFTANATGSAEQGQQMSGEQSTEGSAGAAEGKEAAISGENDERVITPQMNYRERVEMQRAIQRRAAAKRNALLQAAGARTFDPAEEQEHSGQEAK